MGIYVSFLNRIKQQIRRQKSAGRAAQGLKREAGVPHQSFFYDPSWTPPSATSFLHLRIFVVLMMVHGVGIQVPAPRCAGVRPIVFLPPHQLTTPSAYLEHIDRTMQPSLLSLRKGSFVVWNRSPRYTRPFLRIQHSRIVPFSCHCLAEN